MSRLHLRNESIFLILIFTINVQYTVNQYVKIPFISSHYFIRVNLLIGENKFFISFPINTFNPFTWITRAYDISRYSSVFKAYEFNDITIGNQLYPAQVVNDIISFKDTPYTFNFQFYSTNISSYQIKDAGIGLAYKYIGNDIKKFSFVYQLKQQGVIDSAKFSFLCENDSDYLGSIYFGNIPSNILANKYKTSCNVKDNNDQLWNCDIQRLIIKLHEKQFQFRLTKANKIIWNTINSFNYVPLAFFNILKQYLNVNESELTYEQCGVSRNNERIHIECYDNNNLDIYRNIQITIRIANTNFILNFNDIFDCANENNKCYCLYAYKPSFQNNNYFYLTYAFFHKYITTFDYEKNQLTFYSTTPFDKQFFSLTNQDRHSIYTLIYITLLLGIIVLMYLKCLNNIINI